ncbi:NUDIX domain-containing protein [Microbacterium terrisoli]|uniref:NUDIX domain-containing protein n=1 Tax=Microbacterium terrisoli TaxID=3242192 RepID=UPI00350E36C0
MLGGNIEFGETARDATVREISEEIGLTLPHAELVRGVETHEQRPRASDTDIPALYGGTTPSPRGAES